MDGRRSEQAGGDAIAMAAVCVRGFRERKERSRSSDKGKWGMGYRVRSGLGQDHPNDRELLL